ncbi:MAG: phage holin family protein [Eggerthellaceae bacterium]|nr:phage holin family protein [Eggerthellaceae bacterium]
MGFFVRWIVTAIAVAVAVWLVPGVSVIGSQIWVGVLFLSLILALINMSVKPILQLLSLPVSVITLGLFYLVVNTLMLYLAAWLANALFGIGFEIATFGSAFVAAIVISIVSVFLNGIIGADA